VWSGVPGGTTSVAVVLTDPDAPNGTFVHWIVTGLPGSTNGRLDSARPGGGSRTEVNSAGQAGYTGMCPPVGQTHHYTFEVLALNKRVSYTANATPLDKVKQLRAAATSGGSVTGTFANK
jgi:hypothetical protein